ncbi:MAG: hypothetical protein AAGM67_02675 [Bacteroidota bacterium]
MIANLPTYISVIFGLTTLLSLFLFLRAYRPATTSPTRANWILGGLIVWLLLQAGLSLAGLYNADPQPVPPRFPLVVVPTLLVILAVLVSPRGRAFMDRLPLEALHWIHVVRIPVELVLYWLFLAGSVPEIMTFAGRNFDILAGITAPIIILLGFRRQMMGRIGLLIWNVISLGLLINIVATAILALPSPFQQFGLDQPNWAVLNFPFSWLPAFVVPVVLFAHLVSIRALLKAERQSV